MSRTAAPVMLVGCTSDAGKSFLATALCRAMSDRGLRVAPFKALNLSNYAIVTPGGGEIARAQHLQAQAARVEPDPRMNPVLVKPSSDAGSQIVVRGSYDESITRTPWERRRDLLWPHVTGSLSELRAEYDVVVIEGAGSAAEVNLRSSDIANMAVAVECEADVYVVADTERGGAFAHLLGTYEALEPDERARIKGFILNRFRGDPLLLGDGPAWLEARTGVPMVAVVPWIEHRLPEEDTLHHEARPTQGDVNIALIAYPWASNLDEFDPLVHEVGVTVVPVAERERLDRFDAVILPGSKNAKESAGWLRDVGLDEELQRAAAAGVQVLGVCGGLQVLGGRLDDPYGVESGDGTGLGLLDLSTTLEREKFTGWVERECPGVGVVTGYEIRHGVTTPGADVDAYLSGGAGWQSGNIKAAYLHGLAANTTWRQAYLESLGWKGKAGDWAATIEGEIDRAARAADASGLVEAVLLRGEPPANLD